MQYAVSNVTLLVVDEGSLCKHHCHSIIYECMDVLYVCMYVCMYVLYILRQEAGCCEPESADRQHGSPWRVSMCSFLLPLQVTFA